MNQASRFRYYVYISQRKVDGLYEQISEKKKKKISYEFGVDAKIIKIGRKQDVEEEDPTLSDKLNRVLSLLNEVGDVGTVDEARTYLSGTMEMFWTIDQNLGFVDFYGETSETVLALAGSAGNVIGYEGISPRVGGSALPGIQGYFRVGPEGPSPVGDFVHGVMSLKDKASKRLPQHLEFVARKMFECPPSKLSKHKRVVIGTPLYVALADKPEE